MTETFYDRLGVSPDATTEEIETAYREAIKQVHPDVSDDVDAGERTKRLNKAKRVLTDEDERARYDQLGHAGYTGTGSEEATRATDTGPGGTGSGTSSGTSESGRRYGSNRTASADRSTSGTTGRQESATSNGDSASRRAGDSDGGRGRSQGDGGSRGDGRSRGDGQNRRTGRRHDPPGGTSGRRESGWSDPGDQTRRTGRRHPPPGEGTNRREHSASRRAATEDDRRRDRRADGHGGDTRTDVGSRVGDWADPGRAGDPRDTNQGNRRTRSRRSADGTTRSRGDSTGPAWQSNDVGASTDSPSARRQAAAGATDGPNLDWSWNAWESTGAWAVRQGADRGRRLRLSRFFPMDQSMVLLGSIFFLYPFFVGTMLYPAFPIAARIVVAVCTLLTFAYLLSIPEAAIAIYGLWSVLVPLAILAFPAVSLFSLVGVIGLTATWVPLGLSVLTFSLLRP